MTDTQRDRLSPTLLVGGALAVLAMAGIVFVTPPADGYEFSVYRGYPTAFWALAVAGLFAGQLVILRAALLGEETVRFWRVGLATIMSVEGLLFALPYFRGYRAYDRADVLTHVGFVRNIHELGTVVPSDIYPNIHLLTLALSYATGVSPLDIINSVSIVLPLFSVLTWYALMDRLYDRERALLTLPFATVLVFGAAYVNPSPFVQSTLLVPFVLFLFVRERQLRSFASRAALVVVTAAIVIYHPMTTVFLTFGLVAYVVADWVGNRTLPAGESKWRSSVGNGLTLQFMAALFLSWYYSFEPILNKTREVVEALLGTSGGQSQFEKYGSVVAETSPRLVDLLVVGFAKYGVSAVLLGVGGLYLLVTVRDAVFGKVESGVYELSVLLSFVGFASLSALFLVVDLVTGFGRPLLYVNAFGALLAGPLFYTLYRRTDASRVVTVFLCALLLVQAVFGVATLYHSPAQAESGRQVTDAELEGTQWLLDHRNRFIGVVEYGITLYRFGDTYYGKNKSSQREAVDPSNPPPPDHFGYDRNRTFGSSYGSDRYAIITTKGRQFYPEMYPQYRDSWRFRQRDFDRLDRDPTVAQVYDNGGVAIYRTAGTATDADTGTGSG